MIITTDRHFSEYVDSYLEMASKGEEVEIALNNGKSLILKSVCEQANIPKPIQNTEAKFLDQADKLVEQFNISRDTACCFICNFEDDYICKRFNGGCKNRRLCRDIYKQLKESDF